MPPQHRNRTLPSRRDTSFNKLSLRGFLDFLYIIDILDPPPFIGDSADRVFHTLELAQQIVYELELKDLFRALPITKDLWESKITDRICADHLKRLGYPDHVIRNTSQCLRTSYVSITQAVNAISRGAKPTSKTIKMKDIQEKEYAYSKCGYGMEPPFILQSPSPSYLPGSGQMADLYVLDGDDLNLLKPNVVTVPFFRLSNGSLIVGKEAYDSYVVRKFEDWSLIAQLGIYTSNTSSGGNLKERTWTFHDEFIVSEYDSPVEEKGERYRIIEFWDKQGRKRGESTFLGRGSIDLYSSKGSHYFTLCSGSRVKSWKLDTLDVVFERTLSGQDTLQRLRFNVFEGAAFLQRGCGRLKSYWTVDGRPMSKNAADMIRYGAHTRALEFSDGCRVFWGHGLTVCDDEGEVIKNSRSIDLLMGRWILEGGILFDRFFFIVSVFRDSVDRSLIIYSKKGDELISIVLERQWVSSDHFVDILGRLVIIHKSNGDYVDEIEVIDFRGT